MLQGLWHPNQTCDDARKQTNPHPVFLAGNDNGTSEVFGWYCCRCCWYVCVVISVLHSPLDFFLPYLESLTIFFVCFHMLIFFINVNISQRSLPNKFYIKYRIETTFLLLGTICLLFDIVAYLPTFRVSIPDFWCFVSILFADCDYQSACRSSFGPWYNLF